ncbi:GDSL-type esterase/lipase family protein [Pseudopedobacter beijingensis]|uniref:GDSL-type esterase/lipase family protein n=1 Tax=Pseudopedobacter beijingensis TaxID=1207056 RepID=A0ABW4ICL2_9SPHI
MIRILILAFGLFIAGNGLNAQAVKWDSTYRPPKYKESIDRFNAEPISANEYIFLGNSITASTNWSRLLGLPQAKNRGISGDITFGVLERLQEVIDRKPAKVFVLIGINDIARNIENSLIVANYQKIVSRIRKGSPKTQIYFSTLLPVNASFGKLKNHMGKDDRILYLNEQIKKLVARNVTVIDLYPHFLDENKHLKAELTKDGLHLNPEGYKLWAEILNNGGYLK